MGILLHIVTTGYLITLHSIKQNVPYLKIQNSVDKWMRHAHYACCI